MGLIRFVFSVILAIILPPVGLMLHQSALCSRAILICLLLTLLGMFNSTCWLRCCCEWTLTGIAHVGWLPGVIYALVLIASTPSGHRGANTMYVV
jgi:uncharacterized membrane protein YqaE (UPF0057 family)